LGRRPKEAAKATLDWGFPVLESGITLIRNGRLFFRGVDAVSLARDATVEQVAALLWRLPVENGFGTRSSEMSFRPSTRSPDAGAPDAGALLRRFVAATTDESTAIWQSSPSQLAEGCGTLTRAMLECVTNVRSGTDAMHQSLARAWRLDPDGADLVRAALVLCADHELAASNFTARCIASTKASLCAAVVGALAAQSGPSHVGVTTRVEAMWRDLGQGDTISAMQNHLGADGKLPGFGHRLYSNGDPRAIYLLEGISLRLPEVRRLVAAAEKLTGHLPTLDFALVALQRGLNLPDGAAFCLFSIGRTVGWIAHALEQRESQGLIRPRAVYTGPEPVDGA
jgi:citrate synthase